MASVEISTSTLNAFKLSNDLMEEIQSSHANLFNPKKSSFAHRSLGGWPDSGSGAGVSTVHLGRPGNIKSNC